MPYGHIYAAICIINKLKVMFLKLYTRIYFNVGTFELKGKLFLFVIEINVWLSPLLIILKLLFFT